MADQKITELTELAATPDSGDLVAVVDDPAGAPATKKITVANLTGSVATIELDNLGTTAINTSLISDADSTDDLGSSSVFWANAYIDKIFAGEVGGGTSGVAAANVGLVIERTNASQNGISILSAANRTAGIYMTDSADVDLFKMEYNFSAGLLEFNIQGSTKLSVTTTGLEPSTDSSYDLGDTNKFYDLTFTDELVLSNVGAAAAAANTIRLSAVDLSAGNTMLDIDTEGTGVVGTGTPAADRTIAIGVNGTTYYILASTIA